MTRDALIGWLLLFAGAIGWMVVSAFGWQTAPATALFPGYRVNAIALPLPGLLVGLALVVLQGAQAKAGGSPSGPAGGAILVALLTGLAVSLAIAVVVGVPPIHAALLGICGAVSLLLAWAVVDAIRTGEGLSVETHWGGLGGGLGGVRLSAALSLVILLLVFAGATVAIGMNNPEAKPAPDKAPTSSTKPPKDHAKGSTS